MSKPITKNDMNQRQRVALTNVLDYITIRGYYELKRLDLEECYGDVSVVVTTGMADDEGTMAQYFCRDTYVFWIGSCGGVYQYVENKSGSGCRKVYRKGGTVERMTY